jgi:hypothetical protein
MPSLLSLSLKRNKDKKSNKRGRWLGWGGLGCRKMKAQLGERRWMGWAWLLKRDGESGEGGEKVEKKKRREWKEKREED